MFCPKCAGDTRVCDTRYDGKHNEIFRRRICKDCSSEFFTVEFDIIANESFVKLWKTLTRGSGSRYDERRANE